MSVSPSPTGTSAVREQVVSEAHDGQRLDNYLSRELPGVPKSRLYRALRKGEIRVNRKRARPDHRVRTGDRLRIPPLRQAERQEAGTLPRRWQERIAQRVIYEDSDLLVINKPTGIAVHGGSGLSYGLIEGLRQMRPGDRFLELAHRLDRDTSGLILIARKASMLKALHEALRSRSVDKRYVALVEGRWPRHLTTVEAPLLRHMTASGERRVSVAAEGQPAVTRFRVLERLQRTTLVEAAPVSGRTHQIRVHARHAGHPILGDEKYATSSGEELARELELRRLFLHAQRLSFTLPGGRDYQFEAPLDDELDAIVARDRAKPDT